MDLVTLKPKITRITQLAVSTTVVQRLRRRGDNTALSFLQRLAPGPRRHDIRGINVNITHILLMALLFYSQGAKTSLYSHRSKNEIVVPLYRHEKGPKSWGCYKKFPTQSNKTTVQRRLTTKPVKCRSR